MTEDLRFPRRAEVRAVIVLWSFRALAGFSLAYPVARAFEAFLPPSFPTSDALLFAPGGMYLLESLRLGGRALRAALQGSAPVFVVAALAASFPLAVSLAGLLKPSARLAVLARDGAEAMPPLIALGGTTAFVQALGLTAIGAAAVGLSGSLESLLGERPGDLCLVGLALLACVPLVGLGLALDLARAAVIRHRAHSKAAARAALRLLRQAPGAVVSAWLVPALASALLVGAAALLTGKIDVSRGGAGRVFSVAMLHQGTIAGLVMLRLLWFERALRMIGPPGALDTAGALSPVPQPLLVDTPARSDAPDDPRPDPAS